VTHTAFKALLYSRTFHIRAQQIQMSSCQPLGKIDKKCSVNDILRLLKARERCKKSKNYTVIETTNKLFFQSKSCLLKKMELFTSTHLNRNLLLKYNLCLKGTEGLYVHPKS
jgi:hypothetical protein